MISLMLQIQLQVTLVIVYIISLVYLYFYTYLISQKSLWLVIIGISLLINLFFLSKNFSYKDEFQSEDDDKDFNVFIKIQSITALNIFFSILLLFFIYNKRSEAEFIGSQTEFERKNISYQHIDHYSIIWVNESNKEKFIKFQHGYYSNTVQLVTGKPITIHYDKLANNYWVNIFEKGLSGCRQYNNFLPKKFLEDSVFRVVIDKDGTMKVNGIEISFEKLTRDRCHLD